MKRSILIVFILLVVFSIISFLNASYEFGWVTFHFEIFQQFELFALLSSPILVLYLLIASIKQLSKSKNLIYLITIFIPIALLVFNIYLFFVRIINLFFV
ncbi:MAG: hypothetical protein AB7U79_04275 [Candidatus Izemoplasmatales bacterium]